jgi:predicted ABC-type ATPase
MSQTSPVAIMLAGPNGAGKTTTAMTLFRDILESVDYVNADVIAQGLSGTYPDSVTLEAGRIMLDRLHDLAAKRQNIGFETTGASRSLAPWLAQLKSDGYKVYLFYFWLQNADMAIARVAERVRRGGHFVPDDTIRRRYDAGLRNFFALYRPVADEWQMINNSFDVAEIIATGQATSRTTVSNVIIWNELLERYAK